MFWPVSNVSFLFYPSSVNVLSITAMIMYIFERHLDSFVIWFFNDLFFIQVTVLKQPRGRWWIKHFSSVLLLIIRSLLKRTIMLQLWTVIFQLWLFIIKVIVLNQPKGKWWINILSSVLIIMSLYCNLGQLCFNYGQLCFNYDLFIFIHHTSYSFKPTKM